MISSTLKQQTQNSELPTEGSIVEGAILEKQPRSLLIDLSPYGTGIIRGANYGQARDYIKELKEGSKVLVKIINWDNEEGLTELSLKNLSEEKAWESIKKIKEEGISFPLIITEVNAGGLMGKVKNIKGFLPVSQLSSQHYPKVEGGDKGKILEKLKDFIGKELQVKVLDFDPNTNKLIFSEKLVEKDKIKELIKQYKVGDKLKVVITKIVDFGAFVRIKDQPIDGLIHISEISSQPVNDIHSLLKEGEIKEAKIISINDDKISFSLKE